LAEAFDAGGDVVDPVGHFRHANGPDRRRHALALRDQNIHLPQLGDYALSGWSWKSVGRSV
jgi:hypothetical protein